MDAHTFLVFRPCKGHQGPACLHCTGEGDRLDELPAADLTDAEIARLLRTASDDERPALEAERRRRIGPRLSEDWTMIEARFVRTHGGSLVLWILDQHNQQRSRGRIRYVDPDTLREIAEPRGAELKVLKRSFPEGESITGWVKAGPSIFLGAQPHAAPNGGA